MPEGTVQPKIALPAANITPEDHAKYDAEYDTRWDGYPVDAIVAELNSRERELVAVLSQLHELRAASEERPLYRKALEMQIESRLHRIALSPEELASEVSEALTIAEMELGDLLQPSPASAVKGE